MSWISSIVAGLRTIDRLMLEERRHGELIDDLERRQRLYEARENTIVAEAKAAASATASSVAVQHFGDLGRRVGSLEARVSQLERGADRARRPPNA